MKPRLGTAGLLSLLLLSFFVVGLEAGEVVVLTYSGPIGPISAEYIERGISEAESRGATAVVLRLDTPGGLATSMRQIIQRILNAHVPVVVYVAPRGARAASAGCLIVLASSVAAMAPGTNLGAAHPVQLSGGAVSEKVVNDTVAYARSLAAARGRNADWAEKAVRESASAAQGEALELKVVEIAANDLDDLLRQLEGRVVETARGPVTLSTADAVPLWLEMSWRERVLNVVSDPTLAYLLLVLGLLAVVVEVVTPGGFVAGTLGVLAVLLGLMGLANLPVQASGVALLLLGMVFLVLELKIVSHGLLTAVGATSLVLGSLLLYPRIPGYRVSWLAIGSVVGFWVGVCAVALRLVVKAHRRPVRSGVAAVVGAEGIVKTALNPRGVVLVEGEDWNAEAETAPVAAGEKIRVLEVRGLTLRVERLAEERRG
ncbi:MAG: nodulation protein NfeD [Acidobacteria bacterium]|nr:nodulation protein NfeD [Acidobacteriota bacterium]